MAFVHFSSLSLASLLLVVIAFGAQAQPLVNPACICPTGAEPVCGVDGETYSSDCQASCVNIEIAYKGECTGTAPAATGACPKTVDIVCARNRNTYLNPCQARRAGATVAYKGPCGRKKALCNETCADVKAVWDPICVVKTRSITYANPCYAQCKGMAIEDSVLYQGRCKPECKEQCSQATGGPVCCGEGVEYPNECYARCVGGLTKVETNKCKRGLCKGDQAVNLLTAPCPAGATTANCLRQPCQGETCPSLRRAQCFDNYCTNWFRLTQLGLCQAVWLDPVTGTLVKDCMV